MFWVRSHTIRTYFQLKLMSITNNLNHIVSLCIRLHMAMVAALTGKNLHIRRLRGIGNQFISRFQVT